MSGTMRLTDDAIRAALTPAVEVRAPAGLAEGIRAAIDTTPQRRSGLIGWAPSRRTRLVLQLVAVGLVLLGLLGVLLLAGSRRSAPPTSPSVTTYRGGPERTGIMPGPGPVGAPSLEWEVGVKGPISAGSPVIQDGIVYIGDESGFVSAITESTGTILWQHDVGAPINSGLSVAAGLVIVGDDDGVIHALEVAADGTERWTYQAGGPVHSSSAVIDGVVYTASLDGHLYALDLTTGKLRWPAPVATAGPISRGIAVANGVIYAGSGGATATDAGSLGAYDATTGALRWSAPLEAGNTSTPMVADGKVFASGGLDATAVTTHELYAFDAVTGRAAWPRPFTVPTGDILLPGAVADGQVFAESVDGSLYVLDAATGTQLWTAPIQATLSPSGGVVGGVFYATSDDRKIHAFDIASHTETWAIAVKGTPSAPAIVNGRIVVGTSLGQVASIAGSSAPPGAGATP
jgi:outer membrane protein assembly factor BamB